MVQQEGCLSLRWTYSTFEETASTLADLHRQCEQISDIFPKQWMIYSESFHILLPVEGNNEYSEAAQIEDSYTQLPPRAKGPDGALRSTDNLKV